MADVIATVSVALVVDEVLAPDEVHTKTPGFDIMDTDILVEPEIGIEAFSKKIDSPSNRHSIPPS